MTPEVLAKLTHCQNPSDPGGITWEMVAMAKTLLRADASLYAEAKYQCVDEERGPAVKALCRLLYQKIYMPRELGGTGIALKYDIPADMIKSLCEVSLREDLYSNRCPTCGGQGVAYVPKKMDCDTCAGTGRIQYTVERTAGMLGCSRMHYYRRWQHPHGDIRQILHTWDKSVYYAVNRIAPNESTGEGDSVWEQTVLRVAVT